MEPNEIVPRLRALGAKTDQVDKALGRAHPAGSRLLNDKRSLKANEIPALMQLVRELESAAETDSSVVSSYVPVDILPTFAGAGGGGTGEGSVEIALISRRLVHDELRGRPSDFVMIELRGDSMDGDFYHGDQILVDKRDTSPAQPGPFALFDGEWNEYVVKNVERADGGKLRIFSTNPKYSPKLVNPDEVRVLGRPVWFGRRC